MDGLNFYYLIEFPKGNSVFPGLNIDEDFPGIRTAVAGSEEFRTYEACTKSAIDFLKQKLEVLNAQDDRYKIFFEKNQFNEGEQQHFDEREVVKIYIADSSETVYNSLFSARVFFVPAPEEAAFYFSAPTTLQ